MVKTKIFKNGGNQAVRIPKRWSFACEEVTIFRRGDELVIRPGGNDWEELEALCEDFSPEFMEQDPEDLAPDKPIRLS